MIVGDSGMFDMSAALSALYGHMGTATVVNASWPGFGLTRNPAGWHHDWPALVAANRPQVVFVMLGGWDWRGCSPTASPPTRACSTTPPMS